MLNVMVWVIISFLLVTGQSDAQHILHHMPYKSCECVTYQKSWGEGICLSVACTAWLTGPLEEAWPEAGRKWGRDGQQNPGWERRDYPKLHVKKSTSHIRTRSFSTEPKAPVRFRVACTPLVMWTLTPWIHSSLSLCPVCVGPLPLLCPPTAAHAICGVPSGECDVVGD